MHHSTGTVNENFDLFALEEGAPSSWNDWFDGAARDADGRAILKVAAVGLIAAGVAVLLVSRRMGEAEMPA